MPNFSLFSSDFGDYVLTPAYDLLCTSLHFPAESRTALDMFDEFESESFRKNGFYKRPDFLKLAELYGMKGERAEKVLDRFAAGQAAAIDLVNRSFLSSGAKQDMLRRLQDRLRSIAD